jgi:hypothetical protein
MKQLDCEILKISKETLENQCLIVKLGSKDRPATKEDIINF